MEPIKELEDCVDAVFNTVKQIKEAFDDDKGGGTSDSTSFNADGFDPTSSIMPTDTADMEDEGGLVGKDDLDEGDHVKIVGSDDPTLNNTEWIYIGPSDSDPDNMAELVNPADDNIDMAIDYSKIRKINVDAAPDDKINQTEITDYELDHPEPQDGQREDDGREMEPLNPFEDLNIKKHEENYSLENAVMSILESTGKQTKTAITECDEKSCDGNCQAEKQDSAPVKRRQFVTKKTTEPKVKTESFEEMKTRKLTEAKEKGFSI